MVFVNIEFLGRKATFHSYRCEWEETVYLFGGDSYNLSGWIFVFIGNGTKIL